MLLGAALGSHWARKGSPLTIFSSVTHSGVLRGIGFEGPKVCFLHIIYVYITDICHIWKMNKNLRKSYKFHGSAAIGKVYGEPFFMIFLCGTCCSGFWGALSRLWGAIVFLGVALGGHWAPKGSPMVIFDSIIYSEVRAAHFPLPTSHFPSPTAYFLSCRIHKSMGSGMLGSCRV